MKKALFAALLVSAPMLAACSTTSAESARRAEAWSRCRTAPNPDIRDRCIATEVALMEARDREDMESRDAAQKAAEDRQAVLEAQGVSPEDARQTTDSGLRLPD